MSDHCVTFSNKEMSLIQDREFLLTKIEIGKKIEALMSKVEKKLHSSIQEYPWPEEVLSKSGKISKGENYRGLPYYMLDFPRRFSKEGTFAFRTMFWWGHFFSATLHLGGTYLENRRGALLTNLDNIRCSKTYICVSNTPWEYHYGRDNYLPSGQIDASQLQAIFTKMHFVKVSCQWPLEEYAKFPDLVLSAFRQFQGWLIER